MNVRVNARDVFDRMDNDPPPLLVCAYDDEDKCQNMGLDDASTYAEFERSLPDISREREIVFVCA